MAKKGPHSWKACIDCGKPTRGKQRCLGCHREAVKGPHSPTPCIDCGEPTRGKRCKGCDVEWRNSPEGRRWASEFNRAAQNRPEVKARKSGSDFRRRHRESCVEAMNRPEVVARNAETTKALHAAGVYDEMYESEEWRRSNSESHLGLQVGPDNLIYGVTPHCIFTLDPTSLAIEEIIAFPGPLQGHAAAGPIVGGELYYSSGHRLMAAKVL